ncbi:hypothetical protein [Psychrosphaera saromensis]|nr:hypothetical protein [Psychrosphaera saromensis]
MSGTFINSFSWPVGLDVVPLVYLHNQQAKTCFVMSAIGLKIVYASLN